MRTENTDKTQPKTTEIAFILDRSGSMKPNAEAAIAGFDEFLRNQQNTTTARAPAYARKTVLPLSRGPIVRPQKAVLYGPEGVGKTTLTFREAEGEVAIYFT